MLRPSPNHGTQRLPNYDDDVCCIQTTMDMFVDGPNVEWNNLNVCRFVSMFTCMCTILNKIHGFGQIISYLPIVLCILIVAT